MRVYVFMLCLFVSAICSGAENTADDLKVQMKIMIEELKSDDPVKIKAFIRKYLYPDDLNNILKEESLDIIANDFIGGNREELKAALELALEKKPVVAADNITYTFDLENSKDVTFRHSVELKIFHLMN